MAVLVVQLPGRLHAATRECEQRMELGGPVPVAVSNAPARRLPAPTSEYAYSLSNDEWFTAHLYHSRWDAQQPLRNVVGRRGDPNGGDIHHDDDQESSLGRIFVDPSSPTTGTSCSSSFSSVAAEHVGG